MLKIEFSKKTFCLISLFYRSGHRIPGAGFWAGLADLRFLSSLIDPGPADILNCLHLVFFILEYGA